jgi:hypothetical protein
MRARQRGAGLLVAVILVVTIAAFAVIVAASQSGGDARAADLHADSVQALYLAETGVERALKRYATGTACTALAEVINDLSSLQTSGATITILDGLTTDFNDVAFVATQTQCRVRVTATIAASGVSRTLHAIVDRNLLDGTDNPTFDNPLTGAAPSGWTGAGFAANGGADGTAPACRRSAWRAKDAPGTAMTANASANAQFTVAPGSTTSVTFYRRVVTRPSDCAGLPASAGAMPGPCGGGGVDSTVCFQFFGTGGAGVWTIASDADTAGGGTAACPSTFNPCSTNYPGYPAKTTIAGGLAMAGATSVNQISYWLQVRGGGRKEIFLDHIELTNPTAVGAAHVRIWRDCSTADDPSTCL